MKRLTLFFWGRSVLLGCVLAGLAGAVSAQLSETPKVVSQNFDITASTLRQTTPVLMMSLGAERNLTFRLDESVTLTDRTIAGLEANIVPKRMKLSSITVYDTAGTLIPERFESTPVTLYKDGETEPGATATGMKRGQETVTLPTEGGMVAAVPVTFTFASEVSVETGVRYSLAFNWKESSVLPAVLAYPSKSLGDIALPGVSLEGSTGGGYVPHVRFTGTAYIHRFILPVKNRGMSLGTLLGQAMGEGKSLTDYVKDSKADAVVLVAELSEGAGLTMDTAVTEGVAFVAASYYATKSLVDHGLESTTVPTITFKNDVSVTGPFTVRGGTPTGSSEPMAAELRLAAWRGLRRLGCRRISCFARICGWIVLCLRRREVGLRRIPSRLRRGGVSCWITPITRKSNSLTWRLLRPIPPSSLRGKTKTQARRISPKNTARSCATPPVSSRWGGMPRLRPIPMPERPSRWGTTASRIRWPCLLRGRR